MKKTILLWGLLGFLLISCEKSQKAFDGIDIAGAMEQLTAFKLSEITDSVTFVPLETTDASLIGNNPQIDVLKDIILVSSRNQSIKVFERKTGKYLNDIGHIGNDPEGYSSQYTLFADEPNALVYISAYKKDFLKYSFEGKFIETIKTDKLVSSIQSSFLMKDENLLIFNNVLEVDEKDKKDLVLYDIKNDKVKDTVAFADREAVLLDFNDVASINVYYASSYLSMYVNYNDGTFFIHNGSPRLWYGGNNVRMYRQYVDTIYNVDGVKIHPFLPINLGEMSWDKEKIGNKEYGRDKVKIDYLIESNKFIYGTYNIGFEKDMRHYNVLYDKKKGITKVTEENYITDDIYNLNHLKITGVSSDGKFVSILQSFDLLEWVETQGIDTSKWMDNLKEEDNPVLVIFD